VLGLETMMAAGPSSADQTAEIPRASGIFKLGALPAEGEAIYTEDLDDFSDELLRDFMDVEDIEVSPQPPPSCIPAAYSLCPLIRPLGIPPFPKPTQVVCASPPPPPGKPDTKKTGLKNSSVFSFSFWIRSRRSNLRSMR